ncbi:MAG: hypothetical protein C4336_06535 [Armatimonadota bacterium]
MVEITVGIREPEKAGKVEPKGIDTVDPTQNRLRRLEREVSELKELMHKLLIAGGTETAEASVSSRAVIMPTDEHPLLRPLMASGVEPAPYAV